MSHHTALVDGFAKLLHSEGLGVYDPDGFFTPGQRGIVVSAFPETPDSIISVSFYLPEYQDLYGRSRRLTGSRIQIRTRIPGHPLATLDVFDALSHLIHRKHLVLNGLDVHGRYLSATQPIQDSNNRWQQSSNWRLTGLETLP